MRSEFFKHAHSLAHFAKIFSRGFELCFAFDQHQNDFPVAGFLGCGFTCFQTIKAKANIAPIGAFRRDVVHLAMLAARFA